MCSTVKKPNKRRFTISSDSDDSFIMPKAAKMLNWKENSMKNVTKREEIIISSDSCQEISNSDTSSDIIPRENITYIEYSSEEE